MQMASIRGYHAPNAVQECLGVLAEEGGRAVVLAGGQSLVPLLRSRQLRPEVILDLNKVDELRAIEAPTEARPLELGAMVRYCDIIRRDAISVRWPALVDAAARIGDLQIQNRGTIGGNLVFGTATTDMKQVVMCLGAEAVVVGPAGERAVAAREAFADPSRRFLEPGELLKALRFPAPAARSGNAYVKVGLNANGRPIIGVAAALTLDDSGVCTTASVVVGGVVPAPCVAEGAAAVLVGTTLDAEAVAAAADAAAHEVRTQTDSRASAEYRKQLIRVYGRKALERAVGRAQEV